jgi:hypothetical protein
VAWWGHKTPKKRKKEKSPKNGTPKPYNFEKSLTLTNQISAI